MENFHGLVDRFAVCEKGQVATQNFVVFRVKKYTWLHNYQCLCYYIYSVVM